MQYDAVVSEFRQLMREIELIENAIMILYWDMRVNLPPKAGEYRGNTIGYLSGQSYLKKTSPHMNELLGILETDPPADEILRAMIYKARRIYDRLTSVPVELYEEYAAHNLKTEVIWQTARKNNDFALFLPWLEKEFDLKRQLAECYGYKDDPLTGLMDESDPGMTRTKMDELFQELKEFLLPFLDQLLSSPVQYDYKALIGNYPREKQAALCRQILEQVGYDFSRGRMDESAHPYTTANDYTDIRLTTTFHTNNFARALLASLHEGGHAMHWQNMSPDLRYTTLARSPSMGIAEAQSRYIENIIGRSYAFWEYCLPIVKQYFPELSSWTTEQFYGNLNALNYSVNRLNADEVTYNLHIIIRYELEKLLFDRDIAFADLPHYWSEKYWEYLKIRPQTDSEGVLQDMHWGSGYIGYFQNYVLGNFYDGHFLTSMLKDIPDMYDQVRLGHFGEIVGWLKEHIHRHGDIYPPEVLLNRIDGETLTAKHYIAYIKDRYSELYKI